jgi:hypothetical protein
MKLPRKILFISVITLSVIFIAVHLFLTFRGKAIIIKQIEAITNKKTTISYFGLTPLFHLEIKNLNIEGLFKADSVFISPSIISLMGGNIVLNSIRLVNPHLTYYRTPPKVIRAEITAPAPTASTQAASAASEAKSENLRPLRLAFKRLKVKNGSLDFIDYSVSPQGLKISLKNIYFRLNNLYFYPRPAITDFELKAQVPWQQGQKEGTVEVQGWLNLFKKDIQATVKIIDIDGIYLYPYYSNWVDLEKARIESAKLNFTSNIQGLNNNVVADCRLELADIVRKPRAPDEPQEKAEKITDVVLELFKALDQGKMVLNFKINTKMTSPKFNFGDIKGAFEDKLALAQQDGKLSVDDVLGLPVKLFQGTVKGATDISKAVIDGTFAVGNEIKKSVEASFKKTTAE